MHLYKWNLLFYLYSKVTEIYPQLVRHNERDGVSNHQPPIVYSTVYSTIWWRYHRTHDIPLTEAMLNKMSNVTWCQNGYWIYHYNDVIMSPIASQITSLAIICSTVYTCADKRKHQSPASLAFVRGVHRRPVNSPHKGPVTRKMFPFDNVIMFLWLSLELPFSFRFLSSHPFG